MLQIGDIVKDVSPEYRDCNMTGIIVDALNVMGKHIFHVQFFDDDEVVPLYSYELEKVS